MCFFLEKKKKKKSQNSNVEAWKEVKYPQISSEVNTVTEFASEICPCTCFFNMDNGNNVDKNSERQLGFLIHKVSNVV